MQFSQGESDSVEGILNHLENIETKINYFEAKNMVFRNFSVVSGYGQGIVVSVGKESYILSNMTKDYVQSQRLNRISKSQQYITIFIVFISISIALFYIILWIIWQRFTLEASWSNALRSKFLRLSIHSHKCWMNWIRIKSKFLITSILK